MAGALNSTIAPLNGSTLGVRTMPNTPALIGRYLAGQYAQPTVTAEQRAKFEALFSSTDQVDAVTPEDDLDTVTALSGSAPTHVFYVLEATTWRALAAASSEARQTFWAQMTSERGLFQEAFSLVRNISLCIHPGAGAHKQVRTRGPQLLPTLIAAIFRP